VDQLVVRFRVGPDCGAGMSSRALERAVSRDEILTSREAQQFLKIGRTKLWELTSKNMIPAYRIGAGRTSSLRYKRSELMAWLDRNRVHSEREG
jgi:excisionase family DNA binding protein